MSLKRSGGQGAQCDADEEQLVWESGSWEESHAAGETGEREEGKEVKGWKAKVGGEEGGDRGEGDVKGVGERFVDSKLKTGEVRGGAQERKMGVHMDEHV